MYATLYDYFADVVLNRGGTKPVLDGDELKANPTQREASEALKKLWQKLGGTIVVLLVAVSAFGLSPETEWRDVPPETRIGDVFIQIDHTDPTFSNEVLSVVAADLKPVISEEVYIAATNACANLGLDPALIPQGGTLGTVGGLLLALAAAVALLNRKTKLLKSDGTAENDFATDLLGRPVANVKANTIALAPAFDATKTYAVDEVVTYNGKLYKCAEAITTAEAWTPAHWSETDVDALIKSRVSLGQMTNLGDGRYEYTGALTDASTQTYPREEA